MKLVCLNVWGGEIYEPLRAYLQELSESADIFCFQEVFRSNLPQKPKDFLGRPNIYLEIAEVLNDFVGYFEKTSHDHDVVKAVDYNVDAGQAIFVKKSLTANLRKNVLIYQVELTGLNPSKDNLPTALQHVELRILGKILQIFNYHGIPYPGDKLDTPERIAHSKKILEYIKKQAGGKILCGDFNLTINTESVNLLTQIGRDLIKDYKIENTRNRISWGNYQNIQHFADFTFVSPGLKVNSFEVPYNEVSDHLPMLLDFSL